MNNIPALPFKRLKRVAEIMYDFGFGLWVGKLKLKYLVPLHKRYMRLRMQGEIPCPIEEKHTTNLSDAPRRLRLALEELGGAYVKLGQMLSLRADIVGEKMADELKKLQDAVPAIPFPLIKKSLEQTFNCPLKSVFAFFEKKPVGSASLAQVYRAKLKDGSTVAVKILRPGIDQTVREDMLLLQFVARLLEEYIPFARSYRPTAIIGEFVEWTKKELNLLNEATHIEHFRDLFADDDNIFIPRVFWDYSTQNILTMEFSEGIHLDDFKNYRKMKSTRKAIADIGMRLAFRQFFEYGFFHGDPHPGNFFVMENNTLCLHDFGIVGRVSSDIRHELIGFYVNFIEKDGDAAVKHLLHMAEINERSDTESFTHAALDELDRWFYAPTKGARISTSFYSVVMSGVRHGVRFPSSIALLAKAIVTMESMALMLDPSFDITERLKPYLDELMRLQFKPQTLAKQGRELIMDSFQIVNHLPDAAQKLVKLASQGEMPVRLDTKDFEQIKKEIDRQSDIRILSLVLVAVMLTTAFLLYLEGATTIFGIPLGYIGFAASVALGAFVIVRVQATK